MTSYKLVKKFLPFVCLAQLMFAIPVYGDSPVNLIDTSYQERIVLHLDKPYYLTGETLWYKAYCINQEGQLSNLSSVLYLELFDEQQQPVSQIRTTLEAGTSHGQIPIRSAWSTGNYTLRVYTAWMRNSSQETFTHRSVAIFNPLAIMPSAVVSHDTVANPNTTIPSTEEFLEINTNQQSYSLRDQVTVTMKNLKQEVLNDLSVSVYPYHSSLEKYHSVPRQQINKSYSTEGYSSVKGLRFYPETVGPIYYGQLDNVAAAYSELLVSTGGDQARVYEPIPVSDQRFAFQLPRNINHSSLYLWNRGDSEVNVVMDSVFDTRTVQLAGKGLSVDSSSIAFIEKQSVNMQISNLYQKFNRAEGSNTVDDHHHVLFYGTPDFSYPLDDYTRFPGLYEVFVEFVKYVQPRRRDGALQMFVWDSYANAQSLANNIFFNQPALVLVDGLPVNDVDLLMEVDPLRIESIDILAKSYHVGDQVFHGIVALNSYNQDFDGTEPFFKLDKINTKPLVVPRSFYHPHYDDTSLNRIPDRRNTLYWNPQLGFDSSQQATLMFYTGDSQGTYQIVIQGINKSGTPIRQTKLFTVRSKGNP